MYVYGQVGKPGTGMLAGLQVRDRYVGRSEGQRQVCTWAGGKAWEGYVGRSAGQRQVCAI